MQQQRENRDKQKQNQAQSRWSTKGDRATARPSHAPAVQARRDNQTPSPKRRKQRQVAAKESTSPPPGKRCVPNGSQKSPYTDAERLKQRADRWKTTHSNTSVQHPSASSNQHAAPRVARVAFPGGSITTNKEAALAAFRNRTSGKRRADEAKALAGEVSQLPLGGVPFGFSQPDDIPALDDTDTFYGP